jgi:hypothetical protein
MSQPYVLPNRKAFADYIARIFLKYRAKDRDPLDAFDNEVDMCMSRGDSSKGTQELMPHQKLIKEYLSIETPYRGILLYHGLGTGKTCSSIGVAESLLSKKNVIVMLPAALQANFKQELRKCGDPIYVLNNHWQVNIIRSNEDRAAPKALGISASFLSSQGRYFTTVPGAEPNWDTLPADIRRGIDNQITDIISSRYRFINYNGIDKESVMGLIPEEDPTKSTAFDSSIVIIDEVHNFISAVVNKSEIKKRIYDALYHAKRCKIVALSGTPVINRPNEVSYLMNLLRGPIQRIIMPLKSIEQWNESAMGDFFRKLPDVDTVEFNSIKRYILVTRNPENFTTVVNAKNERVAVKYNSKTPVTTPTEWFDALKDKFVTDFKGAAFGNISTEPLEPLPTKLEEFASMFLDGLNIKNPLLFQRRIQGLVSYFKGADERMIPRRVDDDKILEQVPMSSEQFTRYLDVRWDEIKRESKKAQKGPEALDENFSSYRMMSRLVCNYAIPAEVRTGDPDVDEDKVDPKPFILQKLVENPDRFLSEAGLATYSPKLLKALRNIKESVGTIESGFRNQFVYSQFESLEGLGVFGAILAANGMQEYKLIKEDGVYREDPSMDPTKPAFAYYTGSQAETRDLMRHIFNEDYEAISNEYMNHSDSIRKSIRDRGGKKLLTILMGTSAAAEGLNLRNTRHIHILEPYWNPARHDQVIGRGIRICSHATRQLVDGTKVSVPQEERTIRISFYMSVFTPDQAAGTEYPNIVPIRRNDTLPKRYDQVDQKVRAPETFMSSDEFLFEIAFEKERIAKAIGLLLKQAAVDCEVHRKLHSREQPVIQCLRFDTSATSEDLAANPSIKDDEPDENYMRNMTSRSRKLQKVKIRDFNFLIDKDTKDVFDLPAFELDVQRLLKIGTLMGDRIQFFTYD